MLGGGGGGGILYEGGGGGGGGTGGGLLAFARASRSALRSARRELADDEEVEADLGIGGGGEERDGLVLPPPPPPLSSSRSRREASNARARASSSASSSAAAFFTNDFFFSLSLSLLELELLLLPFFSFFSLDLSLSLSFSPLESFSLSFPRPLKRPPSIALTPAFSPPLLSEPFVVSSGWPNFSFRRSNSFCAACRSLNGTFRNSPLSNRANRLLTSSSPADTSCSSGWRTLCGSGTNVLSSTICNTAAGLANTLSMRVGSSDSIGAFS